MRVYYFIINKEEKSLVKNNKLITHLQKEKKKNTY